MAAERRTFSSTATVWPFETPRPSAICTRALALSAFRVEDLMLFALNCESKDEIGDVRCREDPRRRPPGGFRK